MLEHLFEFVPVPLWIEDMSAVKTVLDELRATGVVDLPAYLDEHPEVVAHCASLVRVVDANVAAIALHRAPSREALLAGLDQVFTERSFETFARELGRLATGEPSIVEHGEVRTFDGDVLQVSVRIGLDPAQPDWSRAYVAVLDHTEERRAVAEQLALKDRLMRAQRAESLGVLAGGVAHDFNNILMAILGQVELSVEQLEPGSPVRASLLAIESSALRASELSHQMLAFSGRGHFLVEELDLNELVRCSAPALHATIAAGAHLTLDLAEPAPRVRADGGQLQQVLVNLVANASEALVDGRGQIRIETGRVRLEADQLLAAKAPLIGDHPPAGTFGAIVVRDDGTGMTPEVLERLFDPFFSTRFAGRGLGMAAVDGIARGHHAVVHVDSEPGRGTTVRFALPAREQPVELTPAPPARRVATHDQRAPHSGRVLVADDEESVRRVPVSMLERLGFETREVADGLAAIEAVAEAAEAGEPFDLVLLDLTMPRLNGMGALAELRLTHPDLPVVLVSGYDRVEFADAGVAPDGFLPKPYTRAQLEALVATTLGRA